MVAKGCVREFIEFSGFYVSLDLTIPCGRIKLGKPATKLSEFVSREGGDSLLESFEFAHRKQRYHLRFSRANLVEMLNGAVRLLLTRV